MERATLFMKRLSTTVVRNGQMKSRVQYLRSYCSKSSETTLVSLANNCSVKGKVVYCRSNPRPVYAYCGVPFAEAPVGKLRFKPPSPLQLWKGEKDATKFGAISPQPNTVADIAFRGLPTPEEMSEDCLFLNIYTPVRPGAPAKALPVMVWIHGGGFFMGTGNVYDGRALAAKQDVIVVTINYRLGLLGFLSTPDGHIPGNMGILDQLEALRWVQKYINHFGGDPDNVTLFGESAGAISISLHTLSPVAKGLFHRAICQSGTSLHHSVVWTKENAAKFLQASLKPVGCTSLEGPTIESFLAQMSTADLMKHFSKMFGRVVDGYYLTKHPVDLYTAGAFEPVDLLCGVNTNEGLMYVQVFSSLKSIKTKEVAETFLRQTLKQFHFRGCPQAEALLSRVAEKYLGGKEHASAEELVENITAAHGDCQFTAPNFWTAELHSAEANAYVYEFAHRPFFSTCPSWVTSDHTDEIRYVFGEESFFSDDWPDEDKKISRNMMTYWANFAKSGNPNGSAVEKWPKFTSATKEYLQINHSPQTQHNYRPEILEFWNNDIMDMARAKV